MRQSIILSVVLLGVGLFLASADDVKPRPAAELPAVKELPNPFAFADGSPVRTREDWDRHRAELKALFENYVYGHLPPKPEKLTVTKGEVVVDRENGVTIQDLDVKLEHKGKSLTLHVRLALPTDARGPVPVIVQGSFGGRRTPSGRPFALFARRGYAVAQFPFTDAALDSKDRVRGSGVYQLFDDRIDCGVLMAWAWGVSRVVAVHGRIGRYQ